MSQGQGRRTIRPKGMRRPSFAVVGLFVGQDASAWGSERGPVEIESAMDLSPRRELWVNTGTAEKV
jgi:hypothetical protein